MKTKSVNILLNHKFFLYGMIFLSVLQLVNFYKAGSLTCLGAFGVAYYLGCLYTKNKALCLLFANLVATFVLGCEKNLEGFLEGGPVAGGKNDSKAAPPAPPDTAKRPGQNENVTATDTQPPACSTFVTDVDCKAQTNRCKWDGTKEEGKRCHNK